MRAPGGAGLPWRSLTPAHHFTARRMYGGESELPMVLVGATGLTRSLQVPPSKAGSSSRRTSSPRDSSTPRRRTCSHGRTSTTPRNTSGMRASARPVPLRTSRRHRICITVDRRRSTGRPRRASRAWCPRRLGTARSSRSSSAASATAWRTAGSSGSSACVLRLGDACTNGKLTASFVFLQTAGPVLSLRRPSPPFAFVEYGDPESVLRCLEVVNGATLVGKGGSVKSLLVKADEKTRARLDQYEAGRVKNEVRHPSPQRARDHR